MSDARAPARLKGQMRVRPRRTLAVATVPRDRRYGHCIASRGRGSLDVESRAAEPSIQDCSSEDSRQFNGAVVVAVAIVGVVQVAIDQIVHVVAVRDGLVSTAGSVAMARIVAAAMMFRRARVRVALGDGNDVLVDMPIVRVVHVTVM